MLQKATIAATLAVLVAACGTARKDEESAPAVSTSAADNLIPGQLARGAALQTEIRSAGHDCSKVVRAFDQGELDGDFVWDAECQEGEEFGVISRADGTTEVLECEALERRTGTACWEAF